MRAVPVALALLLSTPALAGQYAGNRPAAVELEAVVDVPLFASPDREDPRYYVEAKVGETSLLFMLRTSESSVWLTEGAAGKIGLKVKGEEDDPARTVGAFDLTLGTATLHASGAAVMDPGVSGVDGVLGLGAIEDTAWALLPSQGVLRIAPAEKGAELVSALGGTTVPYTSMPYRKVKTTKGPKAELQPIPYIVPAKFSGVELPSILAIDGDTAVLREGDWYAVRGVQKPAPVVLPDAPSMPVGDLDVEWREVQVAGQTDKVGVIRMGIGPAHVYLPARGQVGIGALAGTDVAVDPVARTLSLKRAASVTLADWAPIKEAALRKALEVTVEEGAEPPTEEQKRDARKAGLPALASHLETQGRFDEALPLRQEHTQLEGERCASWQNLGAALTRAGRPAEAIEPLTKAWSLYQPWSVLPLEERKQIQEDYDDAKADGEAWDGPVPQPSACHTAPGQLAIAEIATGDTATVGQIYPALLDLDATLPLVAGTAALLAGDTEAAEAAYRQAAKMTVGGDDSAARAGLWLATQRRDFTVARAQLERSNFVYGKLSDPELVRLYAEAIRGREGAEGSVKALRDLLAKQPLNVVLLVQLAREQLAAGDAAGSKESLAAARAVLETWSPRLPQSVQIHTTWVDLLLLEGNNDEARRHGEAAAKASPTNGLAWLAMSKVEAAAGNAAKATEYRRRAGVLWAKNPAYALFLQQ
ncbi:MAG: hypothetical protein ACOZNI_20410 [Myxococcota bacterium]